MLSPGRGGMWRLHMADTYTKLYYHVVFTVQNRMCIIRPEIREDVQKYITGITTNKKQKLISIYCRPDHTHVLLGLKPDFAISTVIRDIKANSSRFINENHWIRGGFAWQEGYGAFTCCERDLDEVIHYIHNQEAHHKRKQFREEYLEILRQYNIEYKDEHLFDWVYNGE